MEFPDLHLFPKNHPPSPYDHPLPVETIGDGLLPEGLKLCAVGWLERPGFQTGSVAKDCLSALVDALHGGIFRDGTRGIHSCCLCGKTLLEVKWKRKRITLKGHGHYLLQLGQTVYMAPSLILHYMLDHQYQPPDEFLQAVMHGRFLTEDDLAVTWRSKGE